MLDRIRARRDEIHALARRSRAEKVWVFGSCARQQERPDSDVDFLVQYEPGASLLDAVDLQEGLGSLMGCKVDVVSKTCIDDDRRSWFAHEVRKDMVAI